MFSYHGNGFMQTVGNQGVAPTPKPAPKKVEAIKPKKKESKKPSIIALDKKSIKAITSFKGNPYRPSEPSKNTLKAIVSAIKGKDSHYAKNKGVDDQKNARAKDLKEKEKQTKLLEEIAGKKGGTGGKGGGSFLSGLKGALGGIGLIKGAGLLKGGTKGFLKRLGIAGLVYSALDGYKDALASQMAQQGLSINDATLTDKMSAIIKNVGDSVMGTVAKYGNDALKILGIDYQIDPTIVSKTVDSIQTGVTTALDNIKNNTGGLGNALINGLRGIDSTLGDATAKVSDITSSAMNTATKIFSELGAMTKKQTPEVKEYLAALKKYREEKSGNEIKAKFSKLSKEDIKAENDAKAEVAKKAKVALKHGLTKDFSESYYDEAIKLNDPTSKLEAKAKQEQMKYEALTKGLNKNGSIFGMGGNSDAEIQAQRAKKDNAFTRMYEYKKANGGLTEKEVAQYNNLKKGHIESKIAGKEKHKAKLESKRSGTLTNLVDLKTLKKEAEEGSWYAQSRIKFLHTSKENLDAEIKREESKLDFQDKIIDELQVTVDKLKTLKDSIPLETYTAPVKREGASSTTAKEYKGEYNGETSKLDHFKQLDRNATIASNELGIPKEVIIAQQIQENGWKKKQLTGKNNFFNIKADKSWKGKKSKHRVWEIEHGKKVWKDQMFRDYDDPTASAKDYAKFLKKNKRYKNVLNKGLTKEQTAKELQKAGYATDPNYAKNIISIMHGKTFQEMQNTINSEATGNSYGQGTHTSTSAIQSAIHRTKQTKAAQVATATHTKKTPPPSNNVAKQDKKSTIDTNPKLTQTKQATAPSPVAAASINENMIVKAIKEQTSAIVEATNKGGQAPIVVANKSTNKEVSI